MKSFSNITAVFFFIFGTVLFAQNQKYTGHFVEEGETIQTITDQYKVSIISVKSLNPDVDFDNIELGTLLIIPLKAEQSAKEHLEELSSSQDSDLDKTTHQVKAFETLYSISKQYGLTPQEVEKYNPNINAKLLSIGQIIKIPSKSDIRAYEGKKTIINLPEKLTETYLKRENVLPSQDVLDALYIVKKGDTPWSIARTHDMRVKQLSRLNPDIRKGISPGDIIYLNNTAKRNLVKAIVDAKKSRKLHSESSYVLYKVYSKETVFGIAKKFGVSTQQIYDINENLEEAGLKSEQIIKIPINQESIIYKVLPNKPKLSFNEPIKSKDTINLAIILPLKYRKYEYEIENHSKSLKSILSDTQIGYSLDFYMGALVALDSLKAQGAHINVKILDGEAKSLGIYKLISANSFEHTDVVLGPFYADSFNTLSQYLEPKNIPIISPFLNKGIISRSNTILSTPPTDLLQKKIIDYIGKERLDAKVLLVIEAASDEKKDYLSTYFPDIERLPMTQNQLSIEIDSLDTFLSFKWIPKPLDSLVKDSLKKQKLASKKDSKNINYQALLEKDLESFRREDLDYSDKVNLIFLETKNPSMVAGVTSVLNSFVSDSCRIVLTTTDKNNAFDTKIISNNHLSNLKFQYASINSPLTNMRVPYAKKFNEKFRDYPDRYATRAFDLVFDIIHRMYQDKNLLENLDNYKTRQVESVFDYEKLPEGGYQNVAGFIMKYENLYLKEIE